MRAVHFNGPGVLAIEPVPDWKAEPGRDPVDPTFSRRSSESGPHQVASLYVLGFSAPDAEHDDDTTAMAFAEALEALPTGTIDVAPLVTDVIDLADVPDAFRALERPSTPCKVWIEFQ